MRYWIALFSLINLLALSACQSAPTAPAGGGTSTTSDNGAPGSDRYSQKHDAAPSDRQSALQTANPAPIYEPKSRYGNHSPYRVYGVSYTVMDSANDYIADGTASWYGSKFHGHRTSSGEAYDMYKLSAAHKTLPLPTWAKVTNLDNGKSTIVRVNDRGPFHSERLIDLSWAAAVKLGIDQQGTGRVRVEAITVAADNGSGQSVAAALNSPPPAASSSELYLQLGAFSQIQSAQNLVANIRSQFQWPVVIRPAAPIYRVWLGPFTTTDERDTARQSLAAAGFDAVNAAP